MLAIRDLQCKKNVQLSFAFVNVHGIGPFTTMKTQCFYGEVWLIAVHAPVWLLQWAFLTRTAVSDNCPMKSLSCPFCVGSWFPIPPNDVSTKLGFDYSTGELRLEISTKDLSPGR